MAWRVARSGAQQLDFEDQRRVRRNHAAGAAGPVAELGRDHEDAGAALLHALHAFVPARDDAARAEVELERVVAVLARIEFRALDAVFVEPAGVVHRDRRAGFGAFAGAGDVVVELQSGGGCLHGRWSFGMAKPRMMPAGEDTRACLR